MKRNRFSLPNELWAYAFKPAEFVILAYLCYRCADKLDLKVIASGVHMTVNTVKKHVAELVKKGLVSDTKSPALSFPYAGDEKFFTLPNEIFLLSLPSSAFVVYAYLLFIENRRTHTCHPSYNTIAANTGMAKNTAVKSIGVLADLDLIAMERSKYFDTHGMKWNGNNLYTILPIRVAVGEHYQRQLERLELDRQRVAAQRLAAPQEPPCAALEGTAGKDSPSHFSSAS